jgi:hypothetical protein
MIIKNYFMLVLVFFSLVSVRVPALNFVQSYLRLEIFLFCFLSCNSNHFYRYVDWFIDYLRFYVLLKNISHIWRHRHCRWRDTKFRPMLCAQGLWAGKVLYRAIPTVTRDLGFSGLIRGTALFSRLLRQVCMGTRRTYSNPDPHGVLIYVGYISTPTF